MKRFLMAFLLCSATAFGQVTISGSVQLGGSVSGIPPGCTQSASGNLTCTSLNAATVTIPGAASGSYVKADGGGAGTPSGLPSGCTGSSGGNVNCSGTGTFTTVAAGTINGVLNAATFAGADASIKINACITSVIASGGGTCDASMLGGSQTMSQQIALGTTGLYTSGISVSLLLPDTGHWVWALTDGVSCGIKQFSSTSLLGKQTGGIWAGLVLDTANSSTHMDSMYCTDSSQPSYVRAEGFLASNSGGGTFTNGEINIQQLFDESSLSRVIGINATGDVWHILSPCCGTNFNLIQGFGSVVGTGGGTPLTVLGGRAFSITNSTFNGAGIGKNNITVTSGADVQFKSTYMEKYVSTDNSTPMVYVAPNTGNGPINISFDGGYASTGCATTGCSQIIFTNQTAAGFTVDNYGVDYKTTLGISDIASGRQWFTDGDSIRHYSTGTSPANSFIQDLASNTLAVTSPLGGLNTVAGATVFTPTTAGWYRILSFTGQSTTSGAVEIAENYGGNLWNKLVTFNIPGYGSPITLNALNMGNYSGNFGPVDEIEASGNEAWGSYLDLHVTNVASAHPITIVFYGQSIPASAIVASPVVGATPGSPTALLNFGTMQSATSMATTGSIAVGTSLQVAGGTPMTSQSSANSQIVTCPPGGTSAQYCGADGAWHTGSGGTVTPGNYGAVAAYGTSSTMGTTVYPINGVAIDGQGDTELNATSVATSFQNFSSPILSFLGNYWNGSANANDLWRWQSVLGSGANPTSTLTLSHPFASPGTASVNIPFTVNVGSVAVGVTVSAKEFGLGASPLTADDTCASGNYWIAPVLGSVNTWRKCENGTLSGFGATYTLPTATASILGGVKPDGTSILNSAGAISVTLASIGAQAALTNPVTGTGSGATVGHLAVMGNTSGTSITDGGAVPAAFTPSATNISAVLGGTGGGTANAQTVTLPTAITTYATTNGPGVIVTWKPSVANTGATTLNVSGVGAVNLTKCGTTALVSGDLTTTANAWAQYDGTEFQLFNPQAGICGTSNPTSNFSFSNGIQTNVVSDGSNWSLNNNLTGLAFNMTDGLSWNANTLFYSGATDTGFYRMNPGVASVTQGRQQAGSSGGTLQTSQVATAELVIAPVSSPTTGTLTTAATGGTLNSSTTYYYRVSSIDATAAGSCATPFTGQSTASTEVSTATASGANTATVTIPWTVVPNASGYCVYGRTTGAEQLIATITSGATATYTDTGSVSPSGSRPTINATGFIKSSATQTTVSCSTSGTAVFSEPMAGASDKKVLINLAACLGTAIYAFPVAYTNTPGIFASSTVASSVASSVSNTTVIITGTTSTGTIILEAY